MAERKYFAISVKHTEFKWKFGKPCVLWGHKRTQDDEKRCFAGYTQYPNEAELYSLDDWKHQGYADWMKVDEPVKMCVNFCKKYKNYDTVLVDTETYIAYCLVASLPLNNPYKKEEK